MIKYIDTHTHIYDKAFDRDIGDTILRAKESGIIAAVLPAIDKENHERLLSLSAGYPGYLYPCTGLHPTSVDAGWREELDLVYKNSSDNLFCAIGEIGMDGYWSREFIKEQAEVFEAQLRLACKLNLPVIIHSRDSTEEIFRVLETIREPALRGVFHTFSGSYETYSRLSRYGDFLIGIGGVVTYKNSKLPETLKKIPLERILLETDSPWLTPSPHRGSRNEPSYIPLIAGTVATVKSCPVSEVARVTTNNAALLFGIKTQLSLP
ncbi:MAG: TatD family hydrolase [Bacteroidales bacterium]|nr:TatD family hydrolase [Bacteroidales bacterium]MDD2424587.1 TatD family hydrolase [Bacteroidales bacterium]MDD3988739.1 TatD family hydrolase [Bacteroidales bacterium]MDD4638704.1 TatD family hydrolase [Bacteroidales bacterium]